MPYMTQNDIDLDTIINEQWETLTDPVKALMENNSYQEVIEEVFSKAQITSKEALDSVTLETLLTLLNLQTPAEFSEAIENTPDLSPKQKSIVVEEVSAKLFTLIPVVDDVILEVFSQENIAQRLSKLPEKVRNGILSSTITEAISSSVRLIGLEGDKKKECIEQITLVATGLSTTKDFKEYIATKLQVENEKAVPFFEGVVQNVFSPVREALLDSLGKKTEPAVAPDAHKTPHTEDKTVRGTDPYKEQLI